MLHRRLLIALVVLFTSGAATPLFAQVLARVTEARISTDRQDPVGWTVTGKATYEAPIGGHASWTLKDENGLIMDSGSSTGIQGTFDIGDSGIGDLPLTLEVVCLDSGNVVVSSDNYVYKEPTINQLDVLDVNLFFNGQEHNAYVKYTWELITPPSYPIGLSAPVQMHVFQWGSPGGFDWLTTENNLEDTAGYYYARKLTYDPEMKKGFPGNYYYDFSLGSYCKNGLGQWTPYVWGSSFWVPIPPAEGEGDPPCPPAP